MQLLDISQSLARELAVMDDELQLEDADVGAGVAGACRHGLHIAQPAMKIDKSSLQGRDHIRRREAADEQDGVALDLRNVHPSLDAADHRVQQLVQDRPAVVDLGLRDELRVTGDIGQHERAFLQA